MTLKDLRLVDLRKEFASRDPSGPRAVAVSGVSLDVEKGQLVTLLGPSGCGKTTLLRMIAGFEEPTGGDIYFGERRVNDDPPNARDAAMVFQSYAIFPHLNVFENVAFGLRLRRVPAAQLRERVGRALDITGLAGLAGRSPEQLSGGQQQRVALARCIVMEPRLLLFDEPLSNLDAKLREQMRVEIRELQQRVGITTVYVTHDQVEAMSISDLIVIMNAGAVEQIGRPDEIYARPRSRFVADFLGKANFVQARVIDATHVDISGTALEVRPHERAAGEMVTVVLRPEALAVGREAGMLRGTVRRVMFLGSIAEYLAEVPGVGELLVDHANPAAGTLLGVGEPVYLTPAPACATVL
ncbi:ABC transporter ATP-binding protein [Candidimonas nitroreducens]|uniref:Polyamine ABC transporter ATP-binding protein n=1 Tax=Candidimonas nitroreducens TaxID=683354 RepID=A0A225MMB3_9BURK|nr:ABC transporter ATP-binding protein [Candidimonas nitroreducens]OWT62102.1 polyamine ABC transporter ATP-binding protein [Candidimonas nitroreducens]